MTRELEDAIRLLTRHGYTVERKTEGPLAQQYLDFGEVWERDQILYAEAVRLNRESYAEALDEVNAEAMVEQWSDQTLLDVIEWGSKLPLHIDRELRRAQAAEINRAAAKEYAKRHPIQQMSRGRDRLR